MPANPPRAPGELADYLEAELVRVRQTFGTLDYCTHMTFVLPPTEVQMAIAALRSATGDGGEAKRWLAIATAPRDGTKVLLYRPLAGESNDPVVTIRRTFSTSTHCWPDTIPPGCDGQNFTEGSCYATHWMPLPAPPALGIEARQGRDEGPVEDESPARRATPASRPDPRQPEDTSKGSET